jgi:hypothetical protein
MLTSIKQPVRFEPELGDIIFAAEMLRKFDPEVRHGHITPLICLSQNGWTALANLNINAHDFRARSTYKCPFMHMNIYYWNMPVALISQNPERYEALSGNAYAMDSDWHKKMYEERIFDLGLVPRSLMGHGFTSGTLPSDGTPHIEKTLADVDNGDVIVCQTFIWFNK